MNVAVTIMQAVDWSRFDLEGWLYQFGAWQNSVKGTRGRSVNPIATAMDEAVVKRKKLKLGVKKQRQIVADAMAGDIDFMPKKKQTPKDIVCEIDDNEARAVQRLVLDMQGRSEILDDWLDAVIDRYFYGASIANIANASSGEKTAMDIKFDLKCGLAALHVRYNFIDYFKQKDVSN